MARRTRTPSGSRALKLPRTRLAAVFPTTAFAAVSLVLVVLFLLLTPLARRQGVVQLPVVGEGGRTPALMTRNLAIDKSGALRLDGRQLPADSLKQVLAEVAKQAPQPVLMVSGDRGLTYRQVKAVLDEARAASIQDVRLEVSVARQAGASAAPSP